MRQFVLLLCSILLCGSAYAGATRLNYVAANWPEVEGQDADNQARWNMTADVILSTDPLAAAAFFGLPEWLIPDDLELWGSYGVAGTGFRDVESAPVDIDHVPEVYFRLPAGQAQLDVGVVHNSNGEDGAESRSLNRIFGRVNVHTAGPSAVLDLSISAYSVIDSESDVTREVWTWGDSAEWGLSATGRLMWREQVELQADLRPDWAFVSVGLAGNQNRLYTPFVYAYSGKGARLEALDDPERAFGVGASFGDLF